MDRTQADIQEILFNKALFSEIERSTVLVTGATGLIGSMLVKTFLGANEKYETKINVVGQIRNFEKAKSLYGKMFDSVEFIRDPYMACDYIIHTVSPTTSKYFVKHPVETIKGSVESALEIFEVARTINASMVYLSSMEQYGVSYEPG